VKLLIPDRRRLSGRVVPATIPVRESRTMNREFEARFTAILLALLTVAAVLFAGFNYKIEHQSAIPDDGVLVDLLAEIAPSDAQRQALLVDNPQRFYGFTK